ncbi:MAG: shikimate dehydrogenase, partial [Thermodesulfobacteriota bacterium]
YQCKEDTIPKFKGISLDIKATTKLYGIFGHPVTQSLSPLIHNFAFNKLGLDCIYLGFDIKPPNIRAAINSIKVLNIQGINITIPHKEAVISELDELTESVILTGAVNTIKNENGRLVGYNTDVTGVMRAIKEEFNFDPHYKTALVIGAGGASRAVIAGMCLNGISKIIIVNRTLSKAEQLMNSFSDQFPNIVFKTASLDDEKKLKSFISDSDIFINSASAGMGDIPPLKIPLGAVSKDCPVYDLVYKPALTPLVKQARALNLKAQSGLSMLLYQGVEAFEIWTGIKPPVKEMREILFNS